MPSVQPRLEVKDHSPQSGPVRERGNLMLEVAAATVLLAISLTGAAGMIGAGLTTSSASRKVNQGARFLESVLAGIEAQPPAALLAMNGNLFHDRGTPAQSVFRVELQTTRGGIGRIEVVLVLSLAKTGAEVARVATVRSIG
jgi:Tfp pilus assembly protein PilV